MSYYTGIWLHVVLYRHMATCFIIQAYGYMLYYTGIWLHDAVTSGHPQTVEINEIEGKYVATTMGQPTIGAVIVISVLYILTA